MLIEHIPETMKRASIFTNPATKSMTGSEIKSEKGGKGNVTSSLGNETGGRAGTSRAQSRI
jgi:hypothetical protein